MGREPFPVDPNNTPFAGADNNPILQAVIVHLNALPLPPDAITLSPNIFPSGLASGATIGTFS
ncbi:hypothetical protein N9B74_00530 [bacterium]|nr:hypothetical protein [bacterium]